MIKQYCTHCETVNSHENMMCQRPNCRVETVTPLLEYGDQLGDIKITRLITVWRTSALYEGVRFDTRIIAKVAHRGCEQRLQREAETYAALQGTGLRRYWRWYRYRRRQHPMLPILLPAYNGSDINGTPYGIVQYQNEARCYLLFQYEEIFASGKFLADLLAVNPQPWQFYSTWLIMSLAYVLSLLHTDMEQVHANLHPEIILVDTDKKGIFRPMLLDLGKLIEDTDLEDDVFWLRDYGAVNYLAPELTYSSAFGTHKLAPASPSTDVYGLGLLLYEMLAGKPAYEYQPSHTSSDELRKRIQSSQFDKQLPYIDEMIDQVSLQAVLNQAVDTDPEERFTSVHEFAAALESCVGRVPARPLSRFEWVQVISFNLFILIGVVLLVNQL